MQSLLSRLKPFVRWVILGGILFFLAQALHDHWQEVVAIRLTETGLLALAIALGITLLAHAWAGVVWSWILRQFHQTVGTIWAVRIYLITNIAKYLPGNVWHFYGRVRAVKSQGVPMELATLSVLLEPAILLAAALILILATGFIISSQEAPLWRGLQILGLCVVLLALHPRTLNPFIRLLGKLKAKAKQSVSVEKSDFQITQYPIQPLLGEMLFLSLRGVGFILTFAAIQAIAPDQILRLLNAFSVAWLMGLVLPGAPGGVGVFEATALAVLKGHFAPAGILGALAFYRLISILAEAIAAALASIGHRRLEE